MSVKAARGQSDNNQLVMFQLLNTAGTPSITVVSPTAMASDVSVVDTAVGRATVTIKNFQGPQSGANIQLTPRTTSVMSAAVSVSYSGADLTFEISSEDDTSALTDVTVDVRVEAY